MPPVGSRRELCEHPRGLDEAARTVGWLVDHAFGGQLTAQQLEDLAEYSSFSGRLWGAPEVLHSPNGVELIKSLNYVPARGSNPSPWRAQLVDALAGPAHIATLTETLPGWARKVVPRYANQITATIALAPAGVVVESDSRTTEEDRCSRAGTDRHAEQDRCGPEDSADLQPSRSVVIGRNLHRLRVFAELGRATAEPALTGADSTGRSPGPARR